MLKKIITCSAVTLFVIVGTVNCFANTGPVDITIASENSERPKPAVFPHKVHQDQFDCADCHHGMVDGEKVAYTADLEIQKCSTCHNAEVLPGKLKDKHKLDTPKGYGHANCQDCHKAMEKDDPALKERRIASCTTCHPRNK